MNEGVEERLNDMDLAEENHDEFYEEDYFDTDEEDNEDGQTQSRTMEGTDASVKGWIVISFYLDFSRGSSDLSSWFLFCRTEAETASPHQ